NIQLTTPRVRFDSVANPQDPNHNPIGGVALLDAATQVGGGFEMVVRDKVTGDWVALRSTRWLRVVINGTAREFTVDFGCAGANMSAVADAIKDAINTEFPGPLNLPFDPVNVHYVPPPPGGDTGRFVVTPAAGVVVNSIGAPLTAGNTS